jgi:hypothetical protein
LEEVINDTMLVRRKELGNKSREDQGRWFTVVEQLATTDNAKAMQVHVLLGNIDSY